jgi:hypothetical protein
MYLTLYSSLNLLYLLDSFLKKCNKIASCFLSTISLCNNRLLMKATKNHVKIQWHHCDIIVMTSLAMMSLRCHYDIIVLSLNCSTKMYINQWQLYNKSMLFAQHLLLTTTSVISLCWFSRDLIGWFSLSWF